MQRNQEKDPSQFLNLFDPADSGDSEFDIFFDEFIKPVQHGDLEDGEMDENHVSYSGLSPRRVFSEKKLAPRNNKSKFKKIK